MGAGACPLRILVMDGEPLNAKDRRTYPPDERCFASLAGPNLQITVPNNFPMPAVSAIAKAPQNVTRTVARRTLAPPARAPIAPRTARKPKDAADTSGTSAPAGDTTTMSKGMAAPTENDAAEVSAACTGRAVVISEIPSSSCAWALKAVSYTHLTLPT